MVPPQTPPAVKEKACVTDPPPATSVPKFCGPLGKKTPFVCSNATVRLVVFTEPVFLNTRFMVTPSPGSTTPLVGLQLSVERASASGTMTGTSALYITSAKSWSSAGSSFGTPSELIFAALTVTVNRPDTPAGRKTLSTLFLVSATPPLVDHAPLK